MVDARTVGGGRGPEDAVREGAPPRRSKRERPLGHSSLIPVGTGRYGDSRSHRIVLRRHHRGGLGQCNAGVHRLRSRAGEPFATVTSAPAHHPNGTHSLHARNRTLQSYSLPR